MLSLLAGMAAVAPIAGAHPVVLPSYGGWPPIVAPPPVTIVMTGVSVSWDPSYAESTFMNRILISIYGFPDYPNGVVTITSTAGDYSTLWIHLYSGHAQIDWPINYMSGVTWTVSYDGWSGSTTLP